MKKRKKTLVLRPREFTPRLNGVSFVKQIELYTIEKLSLADFDLNRKIERVANPDGTITCWQEEWVQ